MVRDTNGVSLKIIEDHPLRKNSLRPNLTTICYLEVISGNHRLNPDKDSLRTGTLQMLPIVFHITSSTNVLSGMAKGNNTRYIAEKQFYS
ncbi:unnamed protein product [Dracunculus medinensis]|uniref:Kinesin motor domain-containing protein n=1 Tax=Dracunculus medinensis TaxID=318479 RepID=A0A0N4UNI6_DRAME|nr:unnamed protein product [Dracunculus medinensis]